MKVSTKLITETVAPTVEPVSVTEQKVHLRVDGTDSDTIIQTQIEAARGFIEKRLQKALVQRTYRADLWGFAEILELPLPPLASVTNIKYYNTDSPEVLTTLSTDIYTVDLGGNLIYRAWAQSYPAVAYRHDAVQITFVTGFDPSSDSPQDPAGNVPQSIKSAIKLTAADLFWNREPTAALKITELPTVKLLLDAFREY